MSAHRTSMSYINEISDSKLERSSNGEWHVEFEPNISGGVAVRVHNVTTGDWNRIVVPYDVWDEMTAYVLEQRRP